MVTAVCVEVEGSDLNKPNTEGPGQWLPRDSVWLGKVFRDLMFWLRCMDCRPDHIAKCCRIAE